MGEDKLVPETVRTSGLFVRFAAVLVPGFLVAAGIALSLLAQHDTRVLGNEFSARVGGAGARIAGALERHARRSADDPERWNAPLPQELVASLLSDPAVRCAKLSDRASGATLIDAPVGLGCIVAPDATFTVPVVGAGGADLALMLGFSTDEIAADVLLHREFDFTVLTGALLIALCASWFAFRHVVGRPLRRLLSDLIDAKREIERNGRVRSEFLANISHDIRTPLNGVVSLAEELRRDLVESRHRETIDAICESGEFLRALVDDFLDLSKIDSGNFEFEKTAFEPDALLRELERANAPLAAKKGVAFRVERRGDCVANVIGDPLRIRQVLNNLANNAVKFTSEGEVCVVIDRRTPGVLGIEVSDTGIGIPKAKLARVFESFAQADVSTARWFGGSGLGLAIVRRLVDGMGGVVTLSSTPGVGTTFQVTLPVALATTPAAPPPNYHMLRRCVAGLRALAVDDVATNRLVLEKLLERIGVDADVVASGEEAVAMIGAQTYDVVLMDISMPGMSGVEAFAAIRDKERAQGLDPTPVIAVTANVLRHQVDEYLALGFAGHLAKPIDFDALAAALATARPHPATPKILRDSPAPARKSG